jgi:hypothetical protein
MSSETLSPAVRHGVTLAEYIRHWGRPRAEKSISKDDDRVSVYEFSNGMRRFATVGASGIQKQDHPARFELFMILPTDLAGATSDEVMSLLFDIFTYGLRDDVVLRPGYAIPPSRLVPEAWHTRALLIDEPVGEPDDLSTMHFGSEHIELLWVVPIYDAEYHFIAQNGVERFYELADASEWSLSDPTRPSLQRLLRLM